MTRYSIYARHNKEDAIFLTMRVMHTRKACKVNSDICQCHHRYKMPLAILARGTNCQHSESNLLEIDPLLHSENEKAGVSYGVKWRWRISLLDRRHFIDYLGSSI